MIVSNQGGKIITKGSLIMICLFWQFSSIDKVWGFIMYVDLLSHINTQQPLLCFVISADTGKKHDKPSGPYPDNSNSSEC